MGISENIYWFFYIGIGLLLSGFYFVVATKDELLNFTGLIMVGGGAILLLILGIWSWVYKPKKSE